MNDAQSPQDGSTAKDSGLRKDEHWRSVLALRMKKDEEQCKIWRDEVENILVFSGLFSAIVTAFLIESHKSLRTDSAELTVQILSQIATQLAGNATVQQANTTNGGFLVDNSSVRVNTFWFLSLVVSLTTALIGIISLQWIRIHLRIPSDNARESLALFEMYSTAMDAFYVSHIFTSLPVLVILGLALFLIGLIDFLLDLNTTVAIPVVSAIGLTLAFLLITTTLPGLQSLPIVQPRPREIPLLHCPYRSPQSLLFLRCMALMRSPFRLASKWLASWVKAYTYHRDTMSPNWIKDKIHPVLSRRFPEYIQWRASWQWKDDWTSHGQLWLVQRDMDRIELHQPSSGLARWIADKGRLFPPVFDAVQALRAVEKGLSVGSDHEASTISRCFDDVMTFDFSAHRNEALRYVFSYLSKSYYVPPVEFLAKNSADGDIIFDFAFIRFHDHYGKSGENPPAVIDACLRTTAWLFYEPRIFPAEIDLFGEHPLKVFTNSGSYPPSVRDALLPILDRFFTFAAEYRPEWENINKTTHTSRHTYDFLMNAAKILTKHPLTDTVQAQHNRILSNITARLEDGHDYLFFTASIYAGNCLVWMRRRELPWPSGGDFISMLIALKQYKINFETYLREDKDVGLLWGSLRAQWTKWGEIDAALAAHTLAAVDDAYSPSLITRGPSLHPAQPERGGSVVQESKCSSIVEVIDVSLPLGVTCVPKISPPLTPSLDEVNDTKSEIEVIVISREGGGRDPNLYDESFIGGGWDSSDAPQEAPDTYLEEDDTLVGPLCSSSCLVSAPYSVTVANTKYL